jgi:uncharacterized protein (DUF433 family)
MEAFGTAGLMNQLGLFPARRYSPRPGTGTSRSGVKTMDDLFDPATFFVNFPVYGCFLKGSDGGIPKGRNLSDGSQCVTVFTDKDLASRFVAELGEESTSEILPIYSLEHLTDWLTWCQQAGISHVLFDDAGKGGVLKIPPVPIPGVLQILKGKLSMSLLPQSIAVPLFEDGQGGLRVTGTRIPLERIIYAYQNGENPEGIIDSYDTLQLADVYAVLAWYLAHKEEVEAYLARREKEAKEIRQAIEAQQPDRAGLRDRLMARLKQRQESAHASASQ